MGRYVDNKPSFPSVAYFFSWWYYLLVCMCALTFLHLRVPSHPRPDNPVQGELLLIDEDYEIYHMPCGEVGAEGFARPSPGRKRVAGVKDCSKDCSRA